MRSLDRSTSANRLGIPILDEVLDDFTNPHSRKVDFPHHSQITDTRVRAPVLEICGVGPCSGKTQLLYQLAATALGSQLNDDVQPESSKGAVVWIDTDARFDVYRLYSVLKPRTQDHGLSSTTCQPDLNDLTTQLLQHLHVFRPWSSDSFLSTLNSIPSYLHSFARHFSGGRPLKLIIINNISSFSSQDRLDSESEVNAEGSSVIEQASARLDSSRYSQRYRDIVGSLQRLQRRFSCSIVAGNILHGTSKVTTPGMSSRPHLPGAWTSFCPAKILVSKISTPKFMPGMSAEEAQLEAQARRTAVLRSGFQGWVDRWAEDILETGARDAIGKIKPFQFFVNDQGVYFGRLDDVKD
jgi:hypothetical protein